MFGPFGFGGSYADEDEQYPHAGTLEDKAIFSLEQNRKSFYMQRRMWLQMRAGGPRNAAHHSAFGAKAAENAAVHAEQMFRGFLSQVYLTEDGETTDPKYPIDKMVNSELRRIRQVIILSVANYSYHLEGMMHEEVINWSEDMLFYNLETYVHRYMLEVFEDINVVIPNKKLPPRSAAELRAFLQTLAKKYNHAGEQHGMGRELLVRRIRDEITEYLLVDIPYNNYRLEAKVQAKDDLIPKKKDAKEDAPILH